MKKFEIFQELSKYDTDMKWAIGHCCWKNGADRRIQCRVATDLQFVKNAVSAKCNGMS